MGLIFTFDAYSAKFIWSVHKMGKNRDAQKKFSSHEVCRVSPEARRAYMMGMITERGRFLGTVCKMVCLCYRTVVCPVCLSVTLVYCGQTVGWIEMKLGTKVGLDPGHTVLGGDLALLPKSGPAPPTFGPCLLSPNGWMN